MARFKKKRYLRILFIFIMILVSSTNYSYAQKSIGPSLEKLKPSIKSSIESIINDVKYKEFQNTGPKRTPGKDILYDPVSKKLSGETGVQNTTKQSVQVNRGNSIYITDPRKIGSKVAEKVEENRRRAVRYQNYNQPQEVPKQVWAMPIDTISELYPSADSTQISLFGDVRNAVYRIKSRKNITSNQRDAIDELFNYLNCENLPESLFNTDKDWALVDNKSADIMWLAEKTACEFSLDDQDIQELIKGIYDFLSMSNPHLNDMIDTMPKEEFSHSISILRFIEKESFPY